MKLISNILQIILCIVAAITGTLLIIGKVHLPDNVVLGLVFIMLSLIYLDRER